MKSIKHFVLDDYLISLILHLCLLISLGLISFNIPKRTNELIVEWLTETSKENIQENFAPGGVIQTSKNVQALDNKVSTTSEQNPVIDRISEQTTSAHSIEPPVYRKNGKDNTAPASGVNSSYLSGVKTKLQGGQQGGNGYVLENDDGNIVILKKVLPNPAINDYGKVTLQFRIKRDGTVDNESIIPVLIDDPNYTNESIRALKQWVFSYKSYINSKAYRISFIFKPE